MTLEQSLNHAWMSGRRHVLLLAENGSGKTSLLKNYACLAQNSIPLYVDLASAHGDDYIMSFLLQVYCGTTHSSENASEQRTALLHLFDRDPAGTPAYTLLLDGIDESTAESHKDLHRELKELSACRDIQILIAAPSYEYLKNMIFFDWLANSERLTLQPVSEKVRDAALAEKSILPGKLNKELLACLSKPIYLFPFLELASADKEKASQLSSPAELFSLLLDQDVYKLAKQDGRRAHAEYALRYLLPALACRLDKAWFDKDELCLALGKAYFDTSYRRGSLDSISTEILTRAKKSLDSGDYFNFTNFVIEDLFREYTEEIFIRLGYLISDGDDYRFKHQSWRYYLQMTHVLNEIHRVEAVALPETLTPEIDSRFLAKARKTGASGSELEQSVRDAWLAASSAGNQNTKPRLAKYVRLAACALLCIAVGLFGYRLWREKNEPDHNSDSTAESTETVSTPGEEQAPEREEKPAETETAMLHLKMEPREMSISEFNRAADTIRERLNCLSAGAPFSLEVHDQTITADLPLSIFQEEDIATILECYVSRECRFFLMDYSTLSWPNVHMASIPLRPRDFESVEAVYGRIPPLDFGVSGLEKREYDYLELRMQGGWIDEHREELQNWGELRLGQDIGYDMFFNRSDCFVSTDRKSIICLLAQDEAKEFVDAQVYNLLHEPLANGFNIFFEEEIIWERPEEAMYTGELQCHADDFSDATVTLYYDTSIENVKTGAWIDTLAVTKKRLDSLGRPYAVGYQLIRGKLRLVIKTYPEHWNSQFFSFLTIRYPYQGVKIVSGLRKFDDYYQDLQTEIVEQDDGTLLFKIGYTPNTYRDPDGFINFAQACAAAGETEMRLLINEIPVLSAPIGSIEEDGSLLFTTIFCNGEPIREEQRWLLDFLRELTCGEELPDSISFFGGETDIGEGHSIKERYELTYDGFKTFLKEIVTLVQPDADLYFPLTSPDTVWIDLHLPVDEELPKKAIATVKQIMQQINMESVYVDSLGFYLVEEDNITQERACIVFRKHYYSESVECDTYFFNGRMEKYKDVFNNLIESDSFFPKEKSMMEYLAD